MSDGSRYHHAFPTRLGIAAIGWSAAGIRAVALPATDADAAIAALRRRMGPTSLEAPAGDMDEAVRRITGLFEGELDDLADLPLDLAGIGAFEASVYRLTRAVRPGETTTYGAIAAALAKGASAPGGTGAARAVGVALARNPFPPVVPCHRVLAAAGGHGGFSGPGGVRTKLRMLAIEGVLLGQGPTLFDHFGFDPDEAGRT